MSEIDKVWLESANLKELEDKCDDLTEEIMSISNQIEMEKEIPTGRPPEWKYKAGHAKNCKIHHREIVRRQMKKLKKSQNVNISNEKDKLLIRELRDEVGEKKFFDCVFQVDNKIEKLKIARGIE